ncbi:hypothetical protein V2J09_023155 [Rumex salicifolius]
MSCCAALACGCCSSVASGISNRSARLGYCGLFGFSLILAWILREVAAPLLEHLSCERDGWHHGGWTAKLIIWILLIVLMFFMPNIVIEIYGELGQTASYQSLGQDYFCLFKWLYYWISHTHGMMLGLQKTNKNVCYIGAFTVSGLLFIWFNPSGEDCGLNIFFLVMTMVLAFSFAVIALHPAVNGSLLPASVISIYCAYVCYTALSSEPTDYACNHLSTSSAVSTSTLILGMLTTVLSILYSALRAGSSSTFLSPPSSPRADSKKPLLDSKDEESGNSKKDKEEATPVSYSYTFFHLIFALASMYSAMLLSGWTSSSESSDMIDVGWTSVWVRICTEWVTAGLYVWTLIAPLIISDREFF